MTVAGYFFVIRFTEALRVYCSSAIRATATPRQRAGQPTSPPFLATRPDYYRQAQPEEQRPASVDYRYDIVSDAGG